MRRFIVALFDWVLPRHPHAAAALRVNDAELAELLNPQTLPGARWLHTLFPYHDERVRAVIKATKYYGEHAAADKLAVLAADYVIDLVHDLTTLEGWRDIVVVPIPSSKRRLRERGYNQVAFFARTIAERAGLPYQPGLLTREERPSQVRVMRSRRKANIAGAFTATPEVQNKFVILIDDVAESGATLADSRRALLAQGAKDVLAIAIAH